MMISSHLASNHLVFRPSHTSATSLQNTTLQRLTSLFTSSHFTSLSHLKMLKSAFGLLYISAWFSCIVRDFSGAKKLPDYTRLP